MLVGHTVNWFAITYFDQTQVVWVMQIAVIASITRAFANPTVDRSSNRMRSLSGGAASPSSQYCGARVGGTTT